MFARKALFVGVASIVAAWMLRQVNEVGQQACAACRDHLAHSAADMGSLHHTVASLSAHGVAVTLCVGMAALGLAVIGWLYRMGQWAYARRS